ncbi:PssE/Cps14G family polysaccharide biosynthesis glycosyltransferase [Clostridium paridis]|uniref:Beta(1,3)galactosyltransferase EpsH n=1 Tax=Clostridium paridis TaxID=2803863 RepID=A0A937FHY8_9CLOT|nr:PssE/Cps14G family polysaccharide biosynthesis glycosyltransferase [Clostridium paridis]MBL4932627.1 beta(1,3)galactosyltransferase EpsH [Clostridium paridis]
MIFISLGSQKFQFNRLLEEVDLLVEKGIIEDEVFAQIGYSDYKPKNYRYKEFLDRDEFNNSINKANIVITHGGTGAIISAVKKEKKVIAVARLKKYEEHVDDHQVEIVSQFNEMGLIEGIVDIKDLERAIKDLNTKTYKTYISNNQRIINLIEDFIGS